MSPAETGRPSNKPAVRKLAFAGFISYVGTGAGEIALSVEVYRQTKSVVWLSLTFLLTFGLDGLFRPLAGAIADRFDRQRVMIVSSTLAGIIWGLMAFADDPALLLGLGFLARVVWGPFGISAMAALPNMVSSDDLTWGNALFKTTGSSAQVTGYALGGLLVSVIGTGPVMLLNAASFILGSIIIASVRATFRAPHEEEEEDGRTGIFAGFPYIFRDPALRSLFLVWTTLFLAIDIAVVAELPLADEFGWGEFGFGIINAAWPLGAIAGGRCGQAAHTPDRAIRGPHRHARRHGRVGAGSGRTGVPARSGRLLHHRRLRFTRRCRWVLDHAAEDERCDPRAGAGGDADGGDARERSGILVRRISHRGVRSARRVRAWRGPGPARVAASLALVSRGRARA